MDDLFWYTFAPHLQRAWHMKDIDCGSTENTLKILCYFYSQDILSLASIIAIVNCGSVDTTDLLQGN